MTLAASTVRALGALSAGLLTLGMLSACTPAPEPDPKPTKTALFASDEEAFKAAEETYRAYMDASNTVDLADDTTFDSVYQWLTGTALAPEKESLSLYHAEGLTKVGNAEFDSFTPLTYKNDKVVAQLCIDTRKVDLLNADGTSALPADRAPRQGRKVTFEASNTTTGLRIASSHKPAEGFTC